MLRKAFDNELTELSTELLKLGNDVADAIVTAANALLSRNLDIAQAIIASDVEINKKRHEIETTCISLIARQQPLAGDLRKIAGMLGIVGEIERIGDYAKGITKVSLRIGVQPLYGVSAERLKQMAAIVQRMLSDSMQALANDDSAWARAIPVRDDEVDTLYDQVYRGLIAYAIENPEHIDQVNYVLAAAYNMERAADRVTNICERIVYMTEGQLVELDPDELPPMSKPED